MKTFDNMNIETHKYRYHSLNSFAWITYDVETTVKRRKCNVDLEQVSYFVQVDNPLNGTIAAVRISLKNGLEYDLDISYREFEEMMAKYRCQKIQNQEAISHLKLYN